MSETKMMPPEPGQVRALIFLTVLTSGVSLFVEMIEPKLFQFLKVFGHEIGVVALAMLGLGTAGLISYRYGSRDRAASAGAGLFIGPAVVVSFFFAVLAPNSQWAARSPAGHFLMAGLTALVCSLPYLCAGMVASAAYIRLSPWRVYGWSLLGSGLGIVLSFPSLSGLGAEGSMLAAGAVAALGGLIAAPVLIPAGGFWRRFGVGIAGFAVCAALFAVQMGTAGFDLLKISPRHPRASELPEPGQFATEAMARPGAKVLASKWSAISRVDALSVPGLTLEGLATSQGTQWNNPLLEKEIGESFQTTNHLYSNNLWFSSMPDKVPLKSWTIPYTLLDHPRVLVIGVGGGIDLARALALDPALLVGVEINPATVELMKGPLAEASHGVYGKAEILTMDGRSYAAFTTEKFDLINLVFADLYIPFHNSNVFMESYLYTVEGFTAYLNILSDRGYLAVTKMVGSLQAPTELLRITATAAEALRRGGFDAPKNIVVIGFSSGSPDVYGGTMLVKRTAFTPAELKKIRAELSSPWVALYLPDEPGSDTPFTRLITAADPSEFYRGYPLNIEPATDNKPFFYLFDRGLGLHRDTVFFFLAVTTMVFWLPFGAIVIRKGAGNGPAITLGAALIALLALGYVFAESALVQNLNLYLGGPLYSLSTVSAAFLLYPGITGLLVGRLKPNRPALMLAAPALGLIIYGPILHAIVAHLPPAGAFFRMAAVFAALAPLCLPLGIPFPLFMDWIKQKAGPATAGLFFGVSATAGVVMVSLSLYWSARFGINSLYLTGAAAYLLAAIGGAIIIRSKSSGGQ